MGKLSYFTKLNYNIYQHGCPKNWSKWRYADQTWSIWDLKKIEKVSERTYRMRIILVSRTNRDGAPKPDLFWTAKLGIVAKKSIVINLFSSLTSMCPMDKQRWLDFDQVMIRNGDKPSFKDVKKKTAGISLEIATNKSAWWFQPTPQTNDGVRQIGSSS